MSLQNFMIEQGLSIDNGGAIASIFTYAGTPETFVTAEVGSLCLDTSNGEVYKKKTGVSNTGWELLSGASAIDAFDWKASVVGATVITDGPLADGNFVLSNTGALTIDGQAFVNGARYLIKNQTLPEENGIYTWATGGALTRATDADTSAKVTAGMAVMVEAGSVLNADTMWVLTTDGAINLGVTPLTFSQFGVYTAGNGITISGGSISAQLDAAGGLEFNGTATRINVDATNGSTTINASNELEVVGYAKKALAATGGADVLDAVAIATWSDVQWNVIVKNGTTGRYSAIVHATNLGTGTTVDHNLSSALKVGTIAKPTIGVSSDGTNMSLNVTTTAGYALTVTRIATV